MLFFCSFSFCRGVCTLAVLGPTLQGDTPLALRCLQGLTDDSDDKESDYFGQSLADLAGLLMPDARQSEGQINPSRWHHPYA